MKLFNVLGDNKCFFRAISNCLLGKYVYSSDKQTKMVNVLKETLIEYLKNYPDEIIFSEYKTLEQYKVSLMRDKYHGGAFEAYCLSKILKKSIIIVGNIHKSKMIEYGMEYNDKIYIHYHQNHYQNILQL